MTSTHDDTPLWFLNTRVQIVVPAASGTDRMSVIRHWAPFGDSPPLHVHETEDEVFHVLEGRVRFSVDGSMIDVAAGQTIMAPKGIPHSYIVESPEGAKWLTVTTPGDFEALVRAAARPATARGLPEPGHPTPETKQRLAELCGRNHIRLVGEPLKPRQAV